MTPKMPIFKYKSVRLDMCILFLFSNAVMHNIFCFVFYFLYCNRVFIEIANKLKAEYYL